MDRFSVITGDITRSRTDAIVNAANSSLLGGGGVDGAIHAAGGPSILAECRALRASRFPDGLPPGQAVITRGGNLFAAWVIHTVGPVWHGGTTGEAETLVSAVRNSLIIARDYATADPPLRSVSFPAISTGVYRYPREQALAIIEREIRAWLAENAYPEQITLVLFGRHE